MSDEKPIPLWQKIIAVAYVVLMIAEAVAFRSRLHADFIPLDGGRVSPNILAGIIIGEAVTPFAVLLWPPTKKRLHRFADAKVAGLHAKLDHLAVKHAQLDARHDEHAASLADLHRKIDELGTVPNPKEK